MTRLDRLKQQACKLKQAELRDLASWIENRLQELENLDSQPLPAGDRSQIIEEQQRGSVTYRLEGIKCGRPSCKCAKGELHGPYWYAYYREGGKLKSKYIGKKLPEEQASEDSEETASPAQADWPV